MALWMLYAAAVAALVAAGGLALERLCERADVARRFVWLGALTLAVAIPLTTGPPERIEGSPMGASRDLEIGTVVGAAQETAAFGSVAPVFAWALASLLVFTVLATVLILSLRARHRWERCRIGDERVYVSRRFGPALVGIARPAIVIPRWVLRLGEAVGTTVVRHEREHARAGDHLALLYAALVAVMFPWSPAIWWMCRRLGAAVEIDCDRRVIASGVPASEYGTLLLGIGAARGRGGLFALGMANSESLLERRLRTMGRESGRIGRPTAILLLGLAVASVATACDIPAPTGIAPAVEGVLAARKNPQEQPSTDRDQERVASVRQAFDEENGGILERATGPDGRVRIQGIDPSPAITLSADVAARNPRAQVDGRYVRGGLRALLTMMDTLNFVTGGYYGIPPRVVINTARPEENR